MGPAPGARPMDPAHGSGPWARPMGPACGPSTWARPMHPAHGAGPWARPPGLAYWPGPLLEVGGDVAYTHLTRPTNREGRSATLGALRHV